MKKLFSIIMLGLIFLMAGCSNKDKLETSTYEMNKPGIKLSMEIKYDKDKHVQETITNNTYNYKELGLDKKQFKEYIKKSSAMYSKMSGVKHTIDYGNKSAKEKLTVKVKDVSKESLPVLFSINANKDDTVSLDKLTKNFKKVGFEKVK